MTTLDLVVAAREDAADGVVALTLRAAAGGELPGWEPGSHIDLLLGEGLERQYSLCGDPGERDAWRIAVLREPAGRGGSAHVHDRLHVGTVVEARGPRNNFPLVAAAGGYRFIAGGIGITPVLPMLEAAERAGVPWTLLYGGRTRASMAFVDTLVRRYGTERILVRPQDETGLLDLDGHLRDADVAVYCCGPGPLLDAVEAYCAANGRPAPHVERFTPKEFAAGESHAFDVVLARSGRTVRVEPEVSVLDAVREAGVEVLFSCTEGTCGTCETDVVEGDVEHRDSLLTAEEQAACATMMLCVSRCRGDRLVLDL